MKLAPQDNVAVALRALRAGEPLTLDGRALIIDRDIAVGHKIAAHAIAAGDTILKYNCPIGIATQAITAGAYVHTHNVKS
ncbi:MAG: UxaA family hydrolase, partial [Casimicrobiaceae bacterium]